MSIDRSIGDEERIAKAKLERGKMRGPWEKSRCEHGRVYSFRWIWSIEGSPEGGDIEMGKSGCKDCESQ
jgi:hypothetical protein